MMMITCVYLMQWQYCYILIIYRPRGYTSPKGKKFQEIYSKFRSKCARGIWTLVLLMFLRVSYNPWLITDCTKVNDDGLVSAINEFKLLH